MPSVIGSAAKDGMTMFQIGWDGGRALTNAPAAAAAHPARPGSARRQGNAIGDGSAAISRTRVITAAVKPGDGSMASLCRSVRSISSSAKRRVVMTVPVQVYAEAAGGHERAAL